MDEERDQFEGFEEDNLPLKRWVFGVGKMIKEKGLKREFECKEEVVVDPEPEQGSSRFCKVCGKFFSSGRALGGHMRVHTQQMVEDEDFSGKDQNLKLRRFNKNPIMNHSFSSHSNNVATCVLCDKAFPSQKSLFGHMRCHPDRDWRGIQPPQMSKISPSSTVTDSHKIDENIGSGVSYFDPHVPSWPITAKRSRGNGGGANSVEEEVSETDISEISEAELEAAYELMMLSRGGGESLESDAGNRDFITKKRKIEEKTNNVFDKKSGWSNGIEEEEEESSEENKYNAYFDVGKRMRKKKKKLKFRDLETMQDNRTDYKTSPERYKCTTCKRTFPTHQALGGHRSSHYKGKTCLTEDFDSPVKGEQYEELNEFEANVAGKHRCQICNKTFPTGQALGGHKRCHRTGPVEAPASSVESEEEEEEEEEEEVSRTEVGSGRRVLDFDLNEPAMMEDGDGDEGMKQAADYASSC